jgi:cold shock CspA family protein
MGWTKVRQPTDIFLSFSTFLSSHCEMLIQADQVEAQAQTSPMGGKSAAIYMIPFNDLMVKI